jgi:hypothetical protein
MTARGERAGNTIERAGNFCLLVAAIAFPWGVFQQLTFGMTLVKVSGVLLIALALLDACVRRTSPWRRNGLEAPIALFATVCVLSLLWSRAPDATLSRITTYATYLVLFGAVLYFVRQPAQVEKLLLGMSFSAAAVSAVALLSAAGLLTPTHAAPIELYRAAEETFRASGVRRMVTASGDLNEGVFLLVIAFGFLLPYALSPLLMLRRRIGAAAALALLGAAVLLSMSRSGVLVVGVLTAVFVLTRPAGTQSTRARAVTVALVLAGLGVGGYLAFPRVVALFDRLTDLDAVYDSSDAGRLYGLLAAVQAIPHYALHGAGLNASDVLLAESPYAASLRGLTLHSLPLKIMLELGVVGLAAFLWLWSRAVRVVHRHWLAEPGPYARLAMGLTAVLFALLWITLVQPFDALSFYPFIAALAVSAGLPEQTQGERVSYKRLAVPAALLVAVVVLVNICMHEATAARVRSFAAAYNQGKYMLASGFADDAAASYEHALLTAAPPAGPPLQQRRFYPLAAELYQLPSLFRTSPPLMRTGDAMVPQAAAAYRLAQTRLSLTQTQPTQAALQSALDALPDYAAARQALADIYWDTGKPVAALLEYEQAAAEAAHPANAPFAEQAQRLLAEAEALAGSSKPGDAIQAAHAFRRLGLWGRALEQAAKVQGDDAATGDALFYTAVEAWRRHEWAEAEALLLKAVQGHERALYVDALETLRAERAGHEPGSERL